MKKTLLLAIMLAATALQLKSQELKRYYDKIFTDVQFIPNQVYGSNYTYNALEAQFGLTQEEQALDIYLPPASDTTTNRPLIVWAHGGSFLGGTKEDKDIVYFCNEYAKRGFVCVSINYRIGYELPLDSVKAVRTVYRALQDGRAAVRYMRSRAAEFNIDKNRVYFGGTSAGAFIALNTVYLNLPEEVPSYVDTTARLAINTDLQLGQDGIEGLTNTINESSAVMGIINYCGATKTVSWMDDAYSSSIPVISMHGTEDGTVPYGTRVIKLNDLTPIPQQIPLPIVEVQGSYDIDRNAKANKYNSAFYTWYGADHVPYINYDGDSISAAYMDTVMRFTVKYVYERFLGFEEVDGLSENEAPCDFNNGQTAPCALGVADLNQTNVVVYPNPANEVLNFALTNATAQVYLIDLTGKILLGKVLKTNDEQLSIQALPSGVYFVKISSDSGTFVQKIIKQ